MNATEFIHKWRKVQLSERSASQQHFLDLCDLLGHPKPAAADPEGTSFTFERGAAKRDGGDGWADVWKKGHFGWEYKGKHKDLAAAYGQLLQYSEALENPPLLITCDMERIIVHTHFNNAPHTTHEIPLAAMGDAGNLAVLRHVFFDPDQLKPGVTDQSVTEAAARHIAEVAQGLRERGLAPHAVARFLDRIVFCLFAEDVGLLPDGLFSRIVGKTRDDPERFTRMLAQLFDAMAHGGDFGMESIPYFNGDLFTEAPVIELTEAEIEAVHAAAKLDWSAIQPSIFGTLFERGLDPSKRSQLGAHYTSREDILTLVEPVVMQPLRGEWAELRATLDALLTTGKKKPGGKPKKLKGAALKKVREEAAALVNRFRIRLSQVKVLDPACGSGNFLYVTLQLLKDLEKAAITYAADHDLGAFFPFVLPTQLYGIELNPYAYELAQMTVWIGHLQWNRNNGFDTKETPILRPMHSFECRDAILDLSDPAQPKEPEWPRVDFIVGNPPFLGDKLMRGQMGDEYVDTLRALYAGRLPGGSDLCCYWFEKARRHVEEGKCRRAGLLATQGIRGGANRESLKRILGSGGIFFAESDRPWVLDGASVHVSIVAFDDGSEKLRTLDGKPVDSINPNLALCADVTKAKPLPENAETCYLGIMKAGAFDIPEQVATEMLAEPNPHGKPNSDVLRPRYTARDILQRTGGGWVIDFGCSTTEAQASLYQAPWDHVVRNVKPVRVSNRRKRLAEKWWIHGEPRPGLRRNLTGLLRFIVTPEVSKHRVFVWLDAANIADHQTRAFCRESDGVLGILHSRQHEVWARAQGTQLRERESGFRYTPTTCFETFPFPRPTPEQEAAIGDAARELNKLREAWLNPPEWTREEVLEFPGSADGPWARYVHTPDGRGIGTVRYPRLVPLDGESAQKLKARTLTNLYNERPTWLDLAHQKLDAAVSAAYGWDPAMGNEEILEQLLALNLERAAAERAGQ